jgi:hypothetical protein
MSQEFLGRVAIDWANFVTLSPDVRRVVFEAISDMGRMGPTLLRYRSETFEQYFAEQLTQETPPEVSINDLLKDEPPPQSEG